MDRLRASNPDTFLQAGKHKGYVVVMKSDYYAHNTYVRSRHTKVYGIRYLVVGFSVTLSSFAITEQNVCMNSDFRASVQLPMLNGMPCCDRVGALLSKWCTCPFHTCIVFLVVSCCIP